MAKPLTPEQQELLAQYRQALVAWESCPADGGTAWASAVQACTDAGFDPFHYPTPQ